MPTQMRRALDDLKIPDMIKAEIHTIINKLLTNHKENINKIVLYGSYAKGTYQPDSDIDLAVALNTLPEMKARSGYKQSVETETELDLLFCTKEQLDSGLFVFKRVNESGVSLYE